MEFGKQLFNIGEQDREVSGDRCVAGLENNSLDWIQGREDCSKDVFSCKVKLIISFICLTTCNR